jgi:phosphoglycolate phosphatase
MNSVLEGMGFPQHPLAAYRYFVGDGVEMLAQRVLPADSRDDAAIARCVQGMREAYERRWAAKSRPYEGMPELLDALTRRGVIMAVLSNKPHAFTEKVVATLLPRWRFARVLGARPGVPKKPDPAAALEIARQLDVPPGRFLYLGDTNTDVRTAIAAGMYPVGALWGFRTAEELTAAGARTLIRHPMELMALLA